MFMLIAVGTDLTDQYTVTYAYGKIDGHTRIIRYKKYLGMFLPREILYIIEGSSVAKACSHLLSIVDLRNPMPVGSQSTLSKANNRLYDKSSLENRAHS